MGHFPDFGFQLEILEQISTNFSKIGEKIEKSGKCPTFLQLFQTKSYRILIFFDVLKRGDGACQFLKVYVYVHKICIQVGVQRCSVFFAY